MKDLYEFFLSLAYIDDIYPPYWLAFHIIAALNVIILSVHLARYHRKLAILGFLSLLNPVTEVLQFLGHGYLLDLTADLAFVAFWSIVALSAYRVWICILKPKLLGRNENRYLRWMAVAFFLFAVSYELMQAQVGAARWEDVPMYAIGMIATLAFARTKKQKLSGVRNRAGIKLQGEGGIA